MENGQIKRRAERDSYTKEMLVSDLAL